MRIFPYLLFLTLSLIACKSAKTTAGIKDQNPPAPGFLTEKSDPRAIEIADKIMQAMGGRQHWDETRYLKWNFFDRRKLLWDKWTGWVRIETTKKDLIIALNINDLQGTAWKDGQAISHPDSLFKYLDLGRKIWINDAYWLVMPFKLKDSGVALHYLGETQNDEDVPSFLLELTFEKVGVTPENKYRIWVDKTTFLVNQWAYFKSAVDEKPSIQNPWKDYFKVGKILLSGNRGEKRKLTEIEAPEKVPENIFRDTGQFSL